MNKLQTEGKFYDRKTTNEFLAGPTYNEAARESLQLKKIRETKETNLQTGLLDSDYLTTS